MGIYPRITGAMWLPYRSCALGGSFTTKSILVWAPFQMVDFTSLNIKSNLPLSSQMYSETAGGYWRTDGNLKSRDLPDVACQPPLFCFTNSKRSHS